MVAAPPRVLDLAGRARTTTVDVVSSPSTEFLVALQTFQFEEAAATFDVGPGWFDEVRTKLSPAIAAALARLGPLGWGSLLARALAERWLSDPADLIDRVEATGPEDLWMVFAGAHLVPFAERVPSGSFRRAAAGDAGARSELADLALAFFGDKEPENGIWTLDAGELHLAVGGILRGWYQDIFSSHMRDVTPVLERDAAAKRRLRPASDAKLIEVATNGIVYVPEPWVRRVVLTPHLAMRPWNVTCAFDDAYVICYPVADESLGVEASAPPAHLIRLHKALADEKRLRILKLLAGSDRTLQEIADAVGLAKSTAHHHMVVLRSAGLIRTSTEPDGRYSLRPGSLDEAGSGLNAFIEGGAS